MHAQDAQRFGEFGRAVKAAAWHRAQTPPKSRRPKAKK